MDFTQHITKAEADFNNGIASNNRGEYDWAIADFTKAIELNPNYAAAYVSRGNAHYYERQYTRARADWEKALQINPNHANARNNLERLRQMGH